MIQHRVFSSFILSAGIFASSLAGATIEWSEGAGGDFFNAANWVGPDVPGTGDTASFNLNETYQVDFSDSVTTSGLAVGNGAVAFNIFDGVSAQTYTLSGDATVGSSGTGSLSLDVLNGTLAIGGVLSIGDISGRDSSFSATGSGTSVTVGNRIFMGAADTTANLTISSGASVSVAGPGSTNLGIESGGVAAIAVNGSSSSLALSGPVNFGNSTGSTASASVTDGGSLTMSNNVLVGQSSGSESLISISGTGSTLTFGGSGNLFIGGANDTGGGDATLVVADGGSVIRSGNSLIVTTPGTVRGDGLLNLGSTNLTVRGGTISPGLPGDSELAIDPSTGTLSITGNYLHQSGRGGGILRIHIEDITNYDKLVVSGNVDLAGGGILEILEIGTPSLLVGQSFEIIGFGGSLSGEFDSINAFNPGPGLSWDFSQLYSAGVISVIPEPSTFALLFAAGALALVVIKRRRK